jgi:eukaryotic-like serine/threonine-protein kinase
MLQARTQRDVFMHLLIIIALAVILVLSFFYLYLPSTTNHGETIEVPALVGMQVNAMESQLNERGLQYLVSDSTFDPSKPPLTVVLQSPDPGSMVKEGRKIYVTVTTGTPPNVKMPRLLGRSFLNAQTELENHGLALGEVQRIPDLQVNTVLKQIYRGSEIKEGSDIPKGTRIDLVVGDGLGVQEFDVPSLVGLPLDEAEFALTGQGLQVGSIVYENRTDKELGTVFKQVPAPGPGRTIRVGEVIDLWIVGFDPNQQQPAGNTDNE